MAEYLLIESRDTFESNAVSQAFQLATGLAAEGQEVTLFLVQNGVLPARRGPRSGELTALAKKGVKVLADDFSLRQRGIALERMAEGVHPAPLDLVVDLLSQGRKALFL